ncbi:TcpQ domain-containing protein [Limnobacter sp.]|uniref:TcpQ domain-containing protein n=1 Tax=Limnobacter sp. TaxID=2003368 RepID=UPI0035181B07
MKTHLGMALSCLLTISSMAWAADNPTPAPAQQWDLRLDDVRLDKALGRWAKEAGYSFRWDADRYVLIGAASTFEGTLPQAVQQVLETPGILYSEYPLEACIYANSPPLLRITRLGDQVRECN